MIDPAELRPRNRLAVFAKVLDVEFNCFANKLLHFRASLADGDAAGQIGDVGADTVFAFFEDNEVFGVFTHLVSSLAQRG
jgi:hypothetical protein